MTAIINLPNVAQWVSVRSTVEELQVQIQESLIIFVQTPFVSVTVTFRHWDLDWIGLFTLRINDLSVE